MGSSEHGNKLTDFTQVRLKLSLALNYATHHEDVSESADIIPLILNLCVGAGEWSASLSGRFTPRSETLVPLDTLLSDSRNCAHAHISPVTLLQRSFRRIVCWQDKRLSTSQAGPVPLG